jgi:hypothetical protein
MSPQIAFPWRKNPFFRLENVKTPREKAKNPWVNPKYPWENAFFPTENRVFPTENANSPGENRIFHSKTEKNLTAKPVLP